MCESDTRSHGTESREIGRGERPRTPQKGKRGYREIGRDGARGEQPRTPPKGKRGYREIGRDGARGDRPRTPPKGHRRTIACSNNPRHIQVLQLALHPLHLTATTLSHLANTHNQYTCDQSLYTCTHVTCTSAQARPTMFSHSSSIL